MKDGQQAGLNLLDGDQQEQRFCDEKKQQQMHPRGFHYSSPPSRLDTALDSTNGEDS